METHAPAQAQPSIHDFLRDHLESVFDDNLSRMGEAIDATPSMVRKWTSIEPRLQTVPSPSSCLKIARALSVDLDYVLYLAGHRDEPGKEPDLDPDLVAVNAAWPRLSNGVREAIRILVGAGGRVSGPSNGRVIGDARRLEEREDGEDWSDDAPPRGLVNCKTPLGRPITVTLLRPALAG